MLAVTILPFSFDAREEALLFIHNMFFLNKKKNFSHNQFQQNFGLQSNHHQLIFQNLGESQLQTLNINLGLTIGRIKYSDFNYLQICMQDSCHISTIFIFCDFESNRPYKFKYF